MRTLGLMPERFFSRLARSTYLSKNRIAFRLSGAPSVQNGVLGMRARRPHHTKIRLSSKPVKTTRSQPTCQPIVPTGFPPVLHKPGSSTAWKSFTKGALGTRQNATSAHKGPMFRHIFGNPAEAEVSKLGKRSCGGSCENAKTLRGSLSPNDNPVAGAISEVI